jgi:hypothetical protein
MLRQHRLDPDAINSVIFSSRVTFDRSGDTPGAAHERRAIMVREAQCIHDQNSSA